METIFMAQKNILVVEDEKDIRMLIARSLDEKKFRVIQAESGAKALKFLENEQPDLILLDVMMPDIDGFELCQKIKDQPKLQKIPVVFLTVRNADEDILRSRKLGAVGYFIKPFDPFQLEIDIERILIH
jgi:DNA-binding response OmpR family regulator